MFELSGSDYQDSAVLNFNFTIALFNYNTLSDSVISVKVNDFSVDKLSNTGNLHNTRNTLYARGTA